MRKTLLAALAAVLLLSPAMQMRAQGKRPTMPEMKLKVGDMAPDFKLQYFDGSGLKTVNLSEYRGKKNVVLAFYVFAFTGG